MKEPKRIEHPIPPLYDKESRILILGSFPSVKSRESAFFYGHPRNRFWEIMAALLRENTPSTVEEKASMLHRNHVAVWDVIKSCEISGSSDSSIRNVKANDLTQILEEGKICRIFCNGATSFKYYKKYMEAKTGMPACRLPSTSPANAAFGRERLIEEWKVICQPLRILPPGTGEVLLDWYDHNARILPWRTDPSPYHVWISEIMLQQTRVEAVLTYYHRWMEEVPDVEALARISDERLLKLWEGLGYYNRARNLKKAAGQIMKDYGGVIPSDAEELKKLSGIGDYTSGAIASIAFGKQEPAVDGNAIRIFSRLLADDRPASSGRMRKDLEKEIRRILPADRPGDFNQALMDLGSGVCLPNGKPLCDSCPFESICMAKKDGRQLSYPVKKEKKARRSYRYGVFILLKEGEVILSKRPAGGLLAGLWEFPMAEDVCSLEAASRFLQNEGIDCSDIKRLGHRKHIFSHVEWEMEGYLVEEAEVTSSQLKEKNWIRAAVEELEEGYAMPSAFEAYKSSILKGRKE